MMFYGQRTIRLKPHVAAKSLLAAPQTQSCQTFQKFQNPAVACCCAGLKNGINEISWNPENSWKWNGKWVPYNQHQPTPKDRDCQFMTFPTLFLELYHFALEPMPSTSAFGVNCRQVTICLARLCRRWWGILFQPCPLWSLEWLKALIAITAYFLLLPKLSALWWCSRFFYGFPLSTDPKVDFA